jgi:opine dehydrogenase
VLILEKPGFAIIGAGNGGQSFAAHLSILGFKVSIFDVDKAKIETMRKKGKINVSGAITGTATTVFITDSIEEAVKYKNIIMVVVPACYHAGVAESLASVVTDGQVIIINPGSTGGALEFANIFNKFGVRAKVTIAETDTLLYACRSKEPGEVTVFGIKERIDFATLPVEESDKVAKLINLAFPQFVAVSNVLYTSLNNANAVCHPIPTIMNAARIEGKCPFEFYLEGVTPSIGEMMEKMDQERLEVGKALGIELLSLKDIFKLHYGVVKDNLYESIMNTKAYKGIMGPTTLNTRFMFEDIPMGLVPIASFGDALGIDTPVTKLFIELACILMKQDYWKEGRTVEKLGLAGLNAKQILSRVR